MIYQHHSTTRDRDLAARMADLLPPPYAAGTARRVDPEVTTEARA